MAAEAKAKGDAAFAAGKYQDAIQHLSDALRFTPDDHALYSDRSAAYAMCEKYHEAVQDAKKTADLQPNNPMAYIRLGAAYVKLGEFDDAVAAYEKGLEYEPDNEALKSGLLDAQATKYKSQNLSGSSSSGNSLSRREGKGHLETEIEKETNKQKEHALLENQAGNDSYEKKELDVAIKHYTKAMELDDGDVSYFINRSVVYFEMGKYNECIEDCSRAVERGRELNSDVELIAKALTRKGSAYVKLAKSAKGYDLAIEAFAMAFTKHKNPEILKELENAKSSKEELEHKEHAADKERELGNKCFGSQQYDEAVKHYTEGIKLNPNDARLYSNRAACYTNLSNLPEGLKDGNKCIEVDPKFVRGYARKGEIQFLMKDYKKALETYEMGLKHGKDNKEILEGISKCRKQMPSDTVNKVESEDRKVSIELSAGSSSQDRKVSIPSKKRDTVNKVESEDRKADPMTDPEIRSILTDPILRQVLIDFQENSRDAEEYTKNPLVMEKLKKLLESGLIRV